MTRYYGLVLVPANTPKDQVYNVAADMLFPHQRHEATPESEFQFDWFLQPDEIVQEEEGLAEYVWNVADIIDRIPELEVESILTPNGQWHYAESGVPDDEKWVEKARRVLQKHRDCLALKHLFHV